MLETLLSAGGHATDVTLEFSWKYLTYALILGGLSAVSLPLGSALGLVVRPKASVTAALTAFGGGALLAALAIELVAPTATGLAAASQNLKGHPGDPRYVEELDHAKSYLFALMGGMVSGALLFYLLDQIVNANGGFLRKTATSIAYISKNKKARQAETLDRLSNIDLLRKIPAEHVNALVDVVRPRVFEDGEMLFNEGDPGDKLYFVTEGTIGLVHDNKPLTDLHSGDVVGEIALLTGAPRTAKATAKGRVKTLSLHKQDFDALREQVPALHAATRDLADTRMQELESHHKERAEEAMKWANEAKDALRQGVEMPTSADLKRASEEHHGAPLAIWLGILLDGIPESFVIGAGLLGLLAGAGAADPDVSVNLTQVIPFTLIAGLFLANFPEAMSSSIGMRTQGWSRTRVLSMWSVLMVMTSIGAGAGYLAGSSVPHMWVIAIEGLAAGAMLTMIISAMIPEAIHLGSSTISAFGILFGFLAALTFKLLE